MAAGTGSGGDPGPADPPGTAKKAGRSGGRRRLAFRLLLLLAGGAALWGLGRQAGDALPGLVARIGALGFWGPAVFVVGYVLAVLLAVPASILTLAGGALFGVLWGSVYVFVAASLGAAAAFLVARYLARGAVERQLAAYPRFDAIDRAVGREGRRIVFLLRLSPAFPFNLLNYALGLTRVGFLDYTIASVGMLPGTVLYVYSGKLAGDVAALTGGAETARSPAELALLGAGLVATLLVTVLVTRLARRALAEAAIE